MLQRNARKQVQKTHTWLTIIASIFSLHMPLHIHIKYFKSSNKINSSLETNWVVLPIHFIWGVINYCNDLDIKWNNENELLSCQFASKMPIKAIDYSYDLSVYTDYLFHEAFMTCKGKINFQSLVIFELMVVIM